MESDQFPNPDKKRDHGVAARLPMPRCGQMVPERDASLFFPTRRLMNEK